jgi:putative ABC transport system permease protein
LPGLVLAWSVPYPGDAWVLSMVRCDMKIDLKGSIFAFPGWIGVMVRRFTVCVTIVAAFYPARRAAKLDPVSALRHD